MKAVHIIILIVGVFLTFATESENATTNLIGLLLIAYKCNRFNLFGYGRNNSCTIVANEQ